MVFRLTLAAILLAPFATDVTVVTPAVEENAVSAREVTDYVAAYGEECIIAVFLTLGAAAVPFRIARLGFKLDQAIVGNRLLFTIVSYV